MDIYSTDSNYSMQSAAVELVNADRASMFLVDPSGKELYAQVFSVGTEGSGHLHVSRTTFDPVQAYIHHLGRKQSGVLSYKGQQVRCVYKIINQQHSAKVNSHQLGIPFYKIMYHLFN